MPTFFRGSNNGQVGRTLGCIDDHTKATIKFIEIKEADNITFKQHQSIITRVTVAHNCNFQFLHTIGNDIYIYVFGDRIGQVTISGLSFTSAGTDDCGNNKQHGFEKIMEWYEKYRVAANQKPIQILIGTKPIEGFVVALSGDIVDPSTRMMQYNLTMMVLPEK